MKSFRFWRDTTSSRSISLYVHKTGPCGDLRRVGALRRLNLRRAAKSVYGGQDTAGIHRFLVWWPLVLRVYTLMLYLFPLIRGLFALDVGAMLFAYVTIGPALPRSIVVVK